MNVSHKWLTEYLGTNAPSAEEIETLLTFHAFEIEGIEAVGDDTVIDVDVLPNRSSDCLSHRGVAREIATLTRKELENDPLKQELELTETDLIDIEIESAEACPRFTASLIEGIEIKESPDWLRQRLEAIGQRSINNIVDATNYVMFAVGQPLHAYDADLFPQQGGKWQFLVRTAKAGEMVSLLAESGKEENRDVEMRGTETLVVDGSDNSPIGLAGVKGGRFAGVHEGTTKVIIEAANWNPAITRHTARPLGIVTDAGKRFENEVARDLALYSQAEIVKLILDIAGGEYKGTADVYLEKKENQPVNVSVARTNALLGLSLTRDEMVEILGRVGCDLSYSDDAITATGPWERTDLNIEEDFIEEIGRVYGYEHVESVVPVAVPLTELNKRHYYSEKVREVLLSQGFSEVITSSFRKKDKIQLRNALASDKSYLRSSLIKNLTEVLDKNAVHTDLLGTSDTRVFEIGTVFNKNDNTVTEHTSLTLGVRLRPSGYSGKEDKILNQIIDTLNEKLNSTVNCTIEKGVAEIHFTELLEALPAPTEYEPVPVAEEIAYQPFSVFPAVSRDIAMWTEGVSAAEVEKVLNEHAGDLCVRITLFDEFEKDGQQSYAFRLVFQSKDKTLTDDEVNQVMEPVNEAVTAKGWIIR